MNLTKSQKLAVEMASSWWWNPNKKKIFYIDGAAGTGKTSVVIEIIKKLGLRIDLDVNFITFSGKAALVLQRKRIPATTIHKLIYNVRERRDLKTGKEIIYFELKDRLYPRPELIVVDECSMVGKKLWEDILSFNIPIITLGDTNQLPPVREDQYEIGTPDVTLTEIVRTEEDNPIVYFSRRILDGYSVPKPGTKIGNNVIITKSGLVSDRIMEKSDIILCHTNKTRMNLNRYFRNSILNIKNPYPVVKDKLICRRNDWNTSLATNDNLYFLTNGIIGYVKYIENLNPKENIYKLDFIPDFLVDTPNFYFDNLYGDKRIFEFDNYAKVQEILKDKERYGKERIRIQKFEYAYAITVHLAQGSEWKNVICFYESMYDKKYERQWLYTAVTRATNKFILAYL